MCQPLQVVHTCMSVICFHLELGHNFLESFLATYGFARFFFDKDSRRWRACFLNSVFDCSHLRNSKSDLNIWISVTGSSCRAVKSLSFFTVIVLLLVVLLFVDLLKFRVYVLSYLLSVASLFCPSMFCRTAGTIKLERF